MFCHVSCDVLLLWICCPIVSFFDLFVFYLIVFCVYLNFSIFQAFMVSCDFVKRQWLQQPAPGSMLSASTIRVRRCVHGMPVRHEHERGKKRRAALRLRLQQPVRW